MKKFVRFKNRPEEERTALIEEIEYVAFIFIIGFIMLLAIFLIGVNVKTEESKEETSATYTVDEIELMTTVHNEVKRQLEVINPVKIEFVNAEEPIEPATYIDFIPMDAGYQAILFQAIKEYHVGRGFALALLESESTFDVNAQTTDANGITYYGAWQISEVNAYRMKEQYGLDITNPEENLVAGCAMLHELIEKYSEFGSEYIINAYKGGEGAAKEWYEEGYKLPCCDEITGRAMYWDEVLKGED